MDTLHYNASVESFDFDHINHTVMIFCERARLSGEKLFAINLVIEELVTNIIKYGSEGGAGENIEILLSLSGEDAELVVADNTREFNPLSTLPPDTSLSAEERRIGGLGIFLIKSKVKELLYCYENGRNRIKAII